MKVLFATAELAPHVKVGGLGDASAGLVKELTNRGIDVRVVMPDYGTVPLDVDRETTLDAPKWAGPAIARSGRLGGFEHVTLIETPTTKRPHPYLQDDGSGWPDNDHRFFSFSAAVAAFIEGQEPDVLHLNDWHTALTLGFLDNAPASLLSLHNIAYQGVTEGKWLDVVPHRSERFARNGAINPLAGGIELADRVVTVSPNYAREVLEGEAGFGLSAVLASRGNAFAGILNGIDTEVWNPATDPLVGVNYSIESTQRRAGIKAQLETAQGWEPGTGALIGMVTRLTGQKGVDLTLDLVTELADLGARMLLLGSGDRALATRANELAELNPDRFAFVEGYDEGLSHRIFGGSDFYLMPSRFEPCGLTQMQAMRYGAVPVVAGVGGLVDTVIDADTDRERGTGFVANDADAESVSTALGRAIGAYGLGRLPEIQRRGMHQDWAWAEPASDYLELYGDLTGAR